MTPPEKLEKLRQMMRQAGVEACIIPSTDSHQSEYTAPFSKFREWISGFTGSAGTLVVCLEKAGLWTDSRYFLQAEVELKGSSIDLYRSLIQGTPTIQEWIIQENFRSVAIDGSIFSAKEVFGFENTFLPLGIQLLTNFKPYETVWSERPLRPTNPIFPLQDHQSGESTSSKLERIRTELKLVKTDYLILSMLDEIAWSYNLRGSDIEYNPVAICYACISQDAAWLFADNVKLTHQTKEWLKQNNITKEDYDAFPRWLQTLKGKNVLCDIDKISYELYSNIPADCRLTEVSSPVAILKAIKNKTEIEGFRKAMIQDGIALVRFSCWLDECVKTGINLDEYIVGKKIAEFRSAGTGYFCESFAPIVAKNDHGAIVHYEANPDEAYPIAGQGALLMDTGGQYLDGTTDITRTIYIDAPIPEQYRKDYTDLLKGLIALSTAVFPVGTRGTQLDILARSTIWKRCINYLHGTGHGVGHFLNVHEGPHSIRMNENSTILQDGMVLTNEPGIYRTGKWGIRLENMMLVRKYGSSDFGNFLSFETLTLFPFEASCIRKESLSDSEIEWLHHYHQKVWDTLYPYLDNREHQWLKAKTAPI
jgi:Xaa-Pro aminopeptidase